MKVVLQRSKQSKVTIDGKINGKIDHGYVALVSFTNGDSIEIIDKMIKKIIPWILLFLLLLIINTEMIFMIYKTISFLR